MSSSRCHRPVAPVGARRDDAAEVGVFYSDDAVPPTRNKERRTPPAAEFTPLAAVSVRSESILPHGLLAVEEPSSQESLVRGNRAGQNPEWVETDAEGRQSVHTQEPSDDWLPRLKMRLLAPFVAEDLL